MDDHQSCGESNGQQGSGRREKKNKARDPLCWLVEEWEKKDASEPGSRLIPAHSRFNSLSLIYPKPDHDAVTAMENSWYWYYPGASRAVEPCEHGNIEDGFGVTDGWARQRCGLANVSNYSDDLL